MLLCEDTREFGNAPFGPCVFGLDGSIALYVTAEMRPSGEWIERKDVRHQIDGDQLTYIPASQIKRIEMRLWSKSNGKVAKVAGPELAEEAVEVESSAVPSPECKPASEPSD